VQWENHHHTPSQRDTEIKLALDHDLRGKAATVDAILQKEYYD
jgi:hypothetical protein